MQVQEDEKDKDEDEDEGRGRGRRVAQVPPTPLRTASRPHPNSQPSTTL